MDCQPRVLARGVGTLRHLVFVHDSWFRRCCLGSTKPFTAIGLASEFVPDQEEQGLDRAAAPSLGEVLAVREVQGEQLERWLSAVTPGELSAPAPVPAGRGWPPYARGKSVLECVHVVLGEERAHHGFCVRNLDLLGGPRRMRCRNSGHMRTMQGAGHSRAGGRQYPPPVNVLLEPSSAGCRLPLQRSGAAPRTG
jgi:DinB family protein